MPLSRRALLALACLAVAPLFAANKDHHVVLVSIDGFPAYLWNDPSAPIPVLRKLAAEGARAEAMTVSNPSITWPCHTTMVTGVAPQKHGVLINGLIKRQGPGKPPKVEQWVDKTEMVFVPTLYDVAHKAGLTVAESDWVAITRAKTVNWSFAELPTVDGPVEKAMIAAGLATTQDIAEMGPGNTRRKIAFRDEMWTRAACFMFKNYRPNLLLHHTLNTDSSHHRYGPGTDPSLSALALADRLLGDVVRTVDESGLRAKTTFLIVTDHGFKKVTNYIYPNVVLKEAGLIKAAGPTVSQADAYTIAGGGIAFVFVTDPARKAELLPRLKELLTKAEAVERVIDAREAHTLGMPTPEENAGMGDLILYAKAGYAFSSAVTGTAGTGPALNYSGSHGYFNGDPELDGIFVASGAGIKKGVTLPRVRNLDVAPTIARLLDLDLGPVDGKAMEAILLSGK
ncbi:MAG: ectonucleotide pyrophosphatase/phosphodiesterase [Verrucomicrobiota bacterium]